MRHDAGHKPASYDYLSSVWGRSDGKDGRSISANDASQLTDSQADDH